MCVGESTLKYMGVEVSRFMLRVLVVTVSIMVVPALCGCHMDTTCSLDLMGSVN